MYQLQRIRKTSSIKFVLHHMFKKKSVETSNSFQPKTVHKQSRLKNVQCCGPVTNLVTSLQPLQQQHQMGIWTSFHQYTLNTTKREQSFEDQRQTISAELPKR